MSYAVIFYQFLLTSLCLQISNYKGYKKTTSYTNFNCIFVFLT